MARDCSSLGRRMARLRPARRFVTVAVAAAVAASLLTATSEVAVASPDRPVVEQGRSAHASKVGRSGGKFEDQTRLAARKLRPEADFPADGDAVVVPVGDAWSDPGGVAVSVRTDDPAKAPRNMAVQIVGEASEDGVGGGGLVFEVTPTKDTGVTDPTPTPTPAPTKPTSAPTKPTPGKPAPSPSASSAKPSVVPSLAAPVLLAAPVDPEPDELAGPQPGVEVEPETGFTAPVEIRVDYSDFASAKGGDWASRLRLVQVTDCEAPDGAADEVGVDCDPVSSGTPLASTNDTESQTVSAMVPAKTLASGSPTTFAVAAADAGSSGTFAATPLNPAGSWTVGGNSGDFAWQYPLETPPAAGGPEPDLAIEYSSSSVDGRMRSKNNQTSWVGEGFSLDPGFIERTYRTCAADNSGTSNAPADSQDLCWIGEYLDISVAGKTSKLVRVSGSGSAGGAAEFRLQQDDGTRVKKLTGAPNGDNNGEYWVVTTPDGTRFYYGLAKRFSGDTQDTKSVSSVPVYGNNDNDPCNGSSFAGSDCKQAWRWGLDYVVDTNGNSMSLFYVQETNYFGSRKNTSVKQYDRAQHLTRIEYGTRAGSENDTPPVRVRFDLKPRCVDTDTFNCSTSTWSSSTATHWPDSPRDRVCTSTSSCSGRVAPTFFTPNRLASITTEVRDGGSHVPVNTWTLKQSFPANTDGTDPALWLEQITQTGKVGGDIELAPVKFGGVRKDNRVNKDGDDAPPFQKYRVSSIDNGLGGITSVAYSAPDCTSSSKPSSSSLHSNARRCFPVWYSSESVTTPRLDFFHKYVVDSVTESDGLANTPDVVTSYDYNGGGAWHYYEDKALNGDYRTWGQWRGFKSVSTRVGADSGSQTFTDTLYMRGMDGDKKTSSGTTSVTVTDPDGGSAVIKDSDYFSGFARRSMTRLGAGGQIVDIEINEPWASAVTASYADATDARIVRVGSTETKTRLGDGSYRTAKEATTYNAYGQPSQVQDHGDTSTADDNTCLSTTYATNTTDWILDRPSVQTTTAGSCPTGLGATTGVLASVRTSYDGLAAGATPTKGNVTTSESALSTALGDGSIVYQTDAATSYDLHGRPTSVTNALDETTTTTYAMSDGLPTSITQTNPLNQTTITRLNKAWGSPNQTEDVAGAKVDYDYDALGRVTKVWVPGREKSSGKSPTHKFTYSLSPTAPSVVKSERLQFGDDTYVPTTVFYDGMLRERSTQTTAAGAPKTGGSGGRLISEKIYDSLGRVAAERGPTFNNDSLPNSTLVTISVAESEAHTDFTFDRASRVTTTSFGSQGDEKWNSTTSYDGDRISVDPPTGDTPTTRVFDVDGHTTTLKQYTGAGPTGASDDTVYTYTLRGELKTVVNAAGNTWTNTYDLRGNRTSIDDPDRGTTTTTFDALDRPKTTTDAKNQKLWTKYDKLGRKTEVRTNDAEGALRTSWIYDTVRPGQLTSSTRHAGGQAYTRSVEAYDDAGRPTSTKVSIPSTEGQLSRPGGYVETTSYLPSGLIDATTLPAAPGLPAGDLAYDYDLLGNPIKGPGVTDITYTPYGGVQQRTVGTSPDQVFDTRTYETGTRRLKTHRVDVAGSSPQMVLDQHYSYDDAGNITRLADVAPGDTSQTGIATDRQCFAYDYLRRLTDAWTTTSATCQSPAESTLGTVAPYWDTYAYDKSGNRTNWTAKTKPGATVQTTTHTYDHPAATAARPHATTQDTASGDDPYAETFTYDANGSMASRSKTATTGQTITWDAEGHQASVTDTATGKKTEYLYGADGSRLIERDETTDTTTLYVGSTEYRLQDGTVTATRNLAVAGEPSLTQTATGNHYVIGDHQGTGLLQIDSTTLAATKRRHTPFGGIRQDTSPWIGGRGFLNLPADPTGTTHLNAREYDPRLGRFLSVDPILDPLDPQQTNGYAYALNNPVTFADPTGEYVPCEGIRCAQRGGGGTYLPKNKQWARQANYNSTRSSIKRIPLGFGNRFGATVNDRKSVARKQAHEYVANFGRQSSRIEQGIRGVFRAVVFDYSSCNGGVDLGCGAEIIVAVPFLRPLKAAERAVDAFKSTDRAAKSESPLSRLLGNRVRDERGSIGPFGRSTTPLTNAQAADMAARVGYTKSNYIVRGQTVFTNGKTYIVQDTTSHSGGLWKMAKSVDGLNSKQTRMGTYDYNLEYIAP